MAGISETGNVAGTNLRETQDAHISGVKCFLLTTILNSGVHVRMNK
jgi:hypothetical protein